MPTPSDPESGSGEEEREDGGLGKEGRRRMGNSSGTQILDSSNSTGSNAEDFPPFASEWKKPPSSRRPSWRSFQHSNSKHHAFPTLDDSAKPAAPPFCFQRRRARIDWRTLHAIDVDQIIREIDVNKLESVLDTIAFGDVQGEDTRNFTEANFVKLFRLSQLMVSNLANGSKAERQWEYVSIVKTGPKGQNTCKCKYCGHSWDGGPLHIRAHILGLKGLGVDKCASAPQDAKDVCRRLHVAGGAQNPLESIDTSVSELGDASHGSGNVDVSKVGSVGVSVSSHKKKLSKSQGSLVKAWDLQARKEATMAVRRFFYAEDVPFWKVRSPYFLDMISAVGKDVEAAFDMRASTSDVAGTSSLGDHDMDDDLSDVNAMDDEEDDDDESDEEGECSVSENDEDDE
ncbi:hypothetical protein L7F22_022614 [Adiantum nelumboides]|nr:hypothetical protein [Adiantum nelumboides]